MKLNRSIGILSKLRYSSNSEMLKIICHSFFGSHLLYGCQLWGQKSIILVNQIYLLQNKALRKNNFMKLHNSAHPIYKELSIFKFHDLIYLQNCLFMLQIELNESLVASFPDLKYCGEHHNYATRSKTQKLCNIPNNKTDTYSTQSAKYNCIKDWNKFKKRVFLI